MDLRTSLSVPDDGILCVVGAGGKKTTLYRLASLLERAVVTATVRIPIFDEHVARVAVTDDPVSALVPARARDRRTPETSANPEKPEELAKPEKLEKSEQAEQHDAQWPLGLVAARDREDRYTGYAPDIVDDLAAVHDGPVLVKADGARVRRLKAPDSSEPQIPATADTVLALASAHVVGDPLSSETVHRPERVAALTGRALGEPIQARDVARVLASDAGGLKRVPDDATPVPVVNMVDDERLESVARDVADGVLAATDRVERVVLTRMTAADPVVDVVTR